MGIAYLHVILYCWSYTNVSKITSHPNRQKLPSSITPLPFDAPAQRNPSKYPHMPYISEN